MDIHAFKIEKPALYKRLCKVAKYRQGGVQLVIENVDKPSNLGAIARSCDALGVQDISYLPSVRHVREKRLIARSSVSASQWLDFTEFNDTAVHFAKLKASGWTIIATSPDPEATSLYAVDFTEYDKVAIAVGSESQGLSETAFAHTDMIINIPMYGVIQSFNVSVATAIVLSQVCQQRQKPGFWLGEEAQSSLVSRWVARHSSKRAS